MLLVNSGTYVTFFSGKSKGRPKKAVLDEQEDEKNFEQVKETPAKTPKGKINFFIFKFIAIFIKVISIIIFITMSVNYDFQFVKNYVTEKKLTKMKARHKNLKNFTLVSLILLKNQTI